MFRRRWLCSSHSKADSNSDRNIEVIENANLLTGGTLSSAIEGDSDEEGLESRLSLQYFRKNGKKKAGMLCDQCHLQRLLQRNIEIEPVAQQVVRRFDGHGHKFALIDLFFPAVNIGIEVDEEGHLKSEHVDKIREEAVLHVLYEENGFDSTKLKPEVQILAPDLDETAVSELLRIKTYLGYDALEQQINEAVDEICRRASLIRDRNPEALKWVTPEEHQAEISRRGWIATDDRVIFSNVREICECISPANKPGGKGKSTSSVILKSTEEPSMLWCPKLAIRDENGSVTAVSDGWVNEFLPDGRIKEWNDNPAKMAKNLKKHWLPRPTFMQMRDSLGRPGYRFIGVYKRLKGDLAQPRIYERISDRFEWSLEKAAEARRLEGQR